MLHETSTSKALPLACLALVFVISLFLFLIRDQRYIGTFAALVHNHEAISAIIVQVLSTLLAIAQMVVICSLINFAARIRLFERTISVGSLSFWSALSIPRADFTLPLFRVLLVLLLLTLNPGLGALWSGSLTPLRSTSSRLDGQILTPSFNLPIKRTMYPADDGRIIVDCDPAPPDPRNTTKQPYPPLDTCIVASKVGILLSTASSATNVTSPWLHPKIDNIAWTYRGRSYGKASSTGLFHVHDTSLKTPDLGFQYEETGYLTNVSCRQQDTSMFPFQRYYSDSLISLYKADAVVSDAGNVSIPPFEVATASYNRWNSHPFGYAVWTAITNNNVHQLITTATDWSNAFGNITCTLSFTPTLFLTNISQADQFITVIPLQSLANGTFNQTGDVVQAVMNELDLMSRIGGSLTYSSVFTAVTRNNVAVKLLYPELSDSQVNERSIEDAITSIVDDLLMHQGILAVARADGESVSTSVTRHFAAIRIGQNGFHITMLVVNIVLCLVYIFEASRTRYWKQLPRFDFVDFKALTLAALGVEQTEMVAAVTASYPGQKHRRSDKDDGIFAYYEKDDKARLRYAISGRISQPLRTDDISAQHPLIDNGSGYQMEDLHSPPRADDSDGASRHSITPSYTSQLPLLRRSR